MMGIQGEMYLILILGSFAIMIIGENRLGIAIIVALLFDIAIRLGQIFEMLSAKLV